MALEDLIAALEAKAEAEAEARLEEARARARSIAADVERRLAALTAQRVADRETELRRQTEARIAAARRGVRSAVLEARAELLERVFAAARTKLEDEVIDSPVYLRELPRHLEEMLAYLGDHATVRCPPALLDPVREALGTTSTLTVSASPDAPPGVVATSGDGRVVVDNSLTGRLDRLRGRLAIELAAELEAAD